MDVSPGAQGEHTPNRESELNNTQFQFQVHQKENFVSQEKKKRQHQ